jgi:hypothetical protein
MDATKTIIKKKTGKRNNLSIEHLAYFSINWDELFHCLKKCSFCVCYKSQNGELVAWISKY